MLGGKVNLPPFVRRIAACSSRKDRHAAKYNITKFVRRLGKISSKCAYFIDNPFKVVVFVRIYCRKSSCLFKHVVFVSFFAIFVTKGQQLLTT